LILLLEKAAQMPYIAGAVVSLGVWVLLFYPFFRGPARFFEAVKLAFRPDIINLFKGGWRRILAAAIGVACVVVLVVTGFELPESYEFQENFNKQAGKK